MKIDEKKYRILSKLIIFTLFTIYLVYSFTYTLNIPYLDDFWAVLRFVNDFNQGEISHYSTFGHINVTSKLLALLSNSIFGSVNFQFMGIIGNCLFLTSIYLLLKECKLLLNIYFLLPFLFLLLNGRYYSISNTGHVSIQHFASLFFSIIAFKNLLKNKLVLSLLFGLLSSLTFGSGIITLFIIGLFLTLKLIKKYFKKYNVALISGISLAIIFILIFSYTVTILTGYNLVNLIYLLGNISSRPKIAFVIGIFALISFLVSLYRQKNSSLNLSHLISIYAIFNIFLIFIVRSSEYSFGPFNSRYSLYSTLLFSLLYVQNISFFKKHITLNSILILVAFVYCIDRYQKGIISSKNFNLEKKDNINNYLKNTCCLCSRFHMEEQCIYIFEKSIELNVIDINYIKIECSKE